MGGDEVGETTNAIGLRNYGQLKGRESIDYQRPSFDQIGITDKFDLSNQVENVRFSNPMLLPGVSNEEGKFYAQAIKMLDPMHANTETDFYSLIIYQDGNQGVKAVGHADFYQYKQGNMSDFVASY